METVRPHRPPKCSSALPFSPLAGEELMETHTGLPQAAYGDFSPLAGEELMETITPYFVFNGVTVTSSLHSLERNKRESRLAFYELPR